MYLLTARSHKRIHTVKSITSAAKSTQLTSRRIQSLDSGRTNERWRHRSSWHIHLYTLVPGTPIRYFSGLCPLLSNGYQSNAIGTILCSRYHLEWYEPTTITLNQSTWWTPPFAKRAVGHGFDWLTIRNGRRLQFQITGSLDSHHNIAKASRSVNLSARCRVKICGDGLDLAWCSQYIILYTLLDFNFAWILFSRFFASGWNSW